MRLVLAIIQPTKLQAVQQALSQIEVERLTICDAQAYSRGWGVELLRGTQHHAGVLRQVILEIAVNEDFLEPTIETIQRVARTGRVGNDGDGLIFVAPLMRVVDIAGRGSGPGAI